MTPQQRTKPRTPRPQMPLPPRRRSQKFAGNKGTAVWVRTEVEEVVEKEDQEEKKEKERLELKKERRMTRCLTMI